MVSNSSQNLVEPNNVNSKKENEKIMEELCDKNARGLLIWKKSDHVTKEPITTGARMPHP